MSSAAVVIGTLRVKDTKSFHFCCLYRSHVYISILIILQKCAKKSTHTVIRIIYAFLKHDQLCIMSAAFLFSVTLTKLISCFPAVCSEDEGPVVDVLYIPPVEGHVPKSELFEPCLLHLLALWTESIIHRIKGVEKNYLFEKI